MNIILTNTGISEIEVSSYELSYPTKKELEKAEEYKAEYYMLRGFHYKRKNNLIIKRNSQIDFPIFVENADWTWIKFEEIAYRGTDAEEWNRDLKQNSVNIKTDPHNFTVFTYRKQEPEIQDPFLSREDVIVHLEGEEYIDTAKDNFHQRGIDLDISLMNESPTTPEDINSPVWLYVLRGTY